MTIAPPIDDMAAETQSEIATLFSADHTRHQANALIRICTLLFPQTRITYDTHLLGTATGEPDLVQFVDDAPPETPQNGDIRFTSGPIDARAEIHVRAGLVADPAALHADDTPTQPNFSGPVLQATYRTPILLERAKHHVEERNRRLLSKRHQHSPLSRDPADANRPKERDRSKRPAILVGFHWLEIGGAEALAFDSVRWALAAGLRVLVIGDRPAPQRLADQLPDHPDVEFLRPDAYLPHDNWFRFLDRLIATENVVALHLHHHKRLYDNLMRLRETWPDLHVIDSTHIIEHKDGGYPRASGVWSRYIDTHHVISTELINYLTHGFGVGPRVRLGRMLPPRSSDAPRPKLRFTPGQKSLRLGFVGRMVHQKRAPLAIHLVIRLRRWASSNGITLHLDMVGTGPYLDVVKTMIRRHGLENMVTLHPAHTDVPALLGEIDMLVIPSANEGLALVGYAAIAAGALPISTDVGAQKELIAPQLLTPKPPAACLRRMDRLIRHLWQDAEFTETCKTATVAQFENLRNDPTAEEELGNLYAEILESARHRPQVPDLHPRLAAVIVTHNRADKLANVLDALARQTRPPDVIFVVDNASTDHTPDLLEQRANTTPNLRILRLDQNLGGAGGFNAGVKAAYRDGAQLVWISDDDAYPAPDAIEMLETALEVFEDDTQIRAPFACSAVRWTDGSLCEMNTPDTVWDWPRFFSSKTPYFLVRSCSFVSVLVPRWAIREHGLPIKDFFIWYDDAEYTLRLARSHPGLFVPDSRVIHDLAVNQGVNYGLVNETTLWKFKYGARNEAAMQLRDRGLPGLAAFAHRVRGQMRGGEVPRPLRRQIYRALLRGLWFRPKIEFAQADQGQVPPF